LDKLLDLRKYTKLAAIAVSILTILPTVYLDEKYVPLTTKISRFKTDDRIN